MDESMHRIRTSDAALWSPMIAALRSLRRWQFWIKVVLILGGAGIGAVGGGMEGPLRVAGTALQPTLKGLFVVLGGGMAFTGGALLLFVDDDVPALVEAARTLSLDAQAYLHERDTLARQVIDARTTAERLDRKRRERLSAIEIMLEVVEAALLSEAGTALTAETMLRSAIHSIRKAVDYEGEDFFTVSIFKREDRGDGEKMHRIAAQWSDPQRAGEGGRAWPKGLGYTGVAWARAIDNPGAEVVESDTTLPHIATEYPVPDGNPVREALYLSVAAIPILVRENDEVWGVVTATSDRRNMFLRDPSALGIQNVQVIRDVARLAGLLAGVDRKAHPPRRSEPKARWFGWSS